MPSFELTALGLTALWLAIVGIWFRRSTPVLIGGLVVVGLYVVTAFISGAVTPRQLGLATPPSWWMTIGVASAWTGVMFAYSPLADWIAGQWVKAPPTLGAFRGLQESLLKLLAGIVIAWLLGGILEELVFRGIVLNSLALLLAPTTGEPVAAGISVIIAALGAGLVHFYQGPRAMIIITQLSILFGILFVISGYNLWAVMLCHGLYDTVAFIRFAMKKSKYSDLDGNPAQPPGD